MAAWSHHDSHVFCKYVRAFERSLVDCRIHVWSVVPQDWVPRHGTLFLMISWRLTAVSTLSEGGEAWVDWTGGFGVESVSLRFSS